MKKSRVLPVSSARRSVGRHRGVFSFAPGLAAACLLFLAAYGNEVQADDGNAGLTLSLDEAKPAEAEKTAEPTGSDRSEEPKKAFQKPVIVEREIRSLTSKPVQHKPKAPPGATIPAYVPRTLLVLKDTQGMVVGLWVNGGDRSRKLPASCVSALRSAQQTGHLPGGVKSMCGLASVRSKTVYNQTFKPREPRKVAVPVATVRLVEVPLIAPGESVTAGASAIQTESGQDRSRRRIVAAVAGDGMDDSVRAGDGRRIRTWKEMHKALGSGIPVVNRTAAGRFAGYRLPYSGLPKPPVMRCLYALEQMRGNQRSPVVCQGIEYAVMQK